MKLKEDSYAILKSVLDSSELPFSKSTNSMLAFDLLEKGDLMSSNQVTKINLVNIIKILCEQLDWTLESEEKIESENVTNGNSLDETNLEIKSVPTSAQTVVKNLQDVCKFYRSGHCQHGRSGKKVIDGKSCAFLHPQICKKFEMFGYVTNQGCKNKKCEKLHLKVCKTFMRYKSCNYGQNCKFHHPKKIEKYKPIQTCEPF